MFLYQIRLTTGPAIKLSNLKSKLRKGKGTKRRRKTRNKKTMKGKKKLFKYQNFEMNVI